MIQALLAPAETGGMSEAPSATGSMTASGDGVARAQALLRIKKRGRTLVVAMRPGMVRDAVVAFFEKDGYGKVLTVETLAQWLELAASKHVDLVFIDGGVKEMQNLELANFLHQGRGHQSFAIVLALANVDQVSETEVKQAGINQLLPKPYTLDAGLALAIEVALDIRPTEISPPATPIPGELRQRPIALAMVPGPNRDALQAFLLGQGFARVLPAGTLGELIRTLHSPSLGLVFVDWEETSPTGLEVAAFLAAHAPDRRFALALAAAQPHGPLAVEAMELGVARLVTKPYELKGPLVEALLLAMGHAAPVETPA